jgi:hypothetical protein
MSRLLPEYKYGVEKKPRHDRRARVEPKVQKFSPPVSAAGTFHVFPLFAVRRTPIRKSLVFGSAGELHYPFSTG